MQCVLAGSPVPITDRETFLDVRAHRSGITAPCGVEPILAKARQGPLARGGKGLVNRRVRDAQQHIQNPDAPRIQVETTLALALSKNGVHITSDFVKALM
jgi:hypothetical protein